MSLRLPETAELGLSGKDDGNPVVRAELNRRDPELPIPYAAQYRAKNDGHSRLEPATRTTEEPATGISS